MKAPSPLPSAMAAGLDRVLRRSPLQAVFQARGGGRRLAVLAYHAVEDEEMFSRHLDYLAARYHPVSLDAVLAALARKAELPRRAVLITFDDADRTVLDRALPLLRARGLPAVAFVVTGQLDGNEPFWWTEVEHLVRAGGRARAFEGAGPIDIVRGLKQVPEQDRRAAIAELRASAPVSAPGHSQLRSADLRLLMEAGVSIGNHTETHPCLPRCSEEEMRREVLAAHQAIATATGAAPVAFAYPNGDWDPRAERALEGLGYRAAFLFDHALTHADGHPFRLSRVRTGSTVSLQRFALIVSGLHPALHRLRSRATRRTHR
jgi:peptidoglycan/xylan/chitin deacetylase (PgdA/CDA1 family)